MIPNSPSSLFGVPYDRPVVGYGGKTVNTLRLWSATASACVRLPALQRRRLRRLDRRGAQRGIADARPLSGRPHGAGARTAAHAGIFPRRLFARRHRSPVPRDQFGLADAARQGGDPDERHASDPRRAGAHAHPARRGASRLGRGLGHHAPDARLHQPHAAARGARALAGRLDAAPHPAPSRDHLTRSTAACSTTFAPAFPATTGARRERAWSRRGRSKHIRMANLAIVGSHSTNGVAAIHSELLRTTTVQDLAEAFPERFNNKTNGVTPRRWLRLANPWLAEAISASIGDGWITDLARTEEAPAAGGRRRVPGGGSARRNARARPGSPTGSSGTRTSPSIRTRSSTARSSAFTNTSASCSMR